MLYNQGGQPLSHILKEGIPGKINNSISSTQFSCKFLSPVQIFDKVAENARFVLQIDNARLAADDFKVK